MNKVESYVVSEVDGIKVLDTLNFLDDFDETIEDKRDWEARVKKFKSICKENNICYYAELKEDFFEHSGYTKAKKENATYLLMENLS